MDIDKVKEAVNFIKEDIEYNEFFESSTKRILVLLDLAERYIACGEKMPQKWFTHEDGQGYSESQFYNQAIEDCTLICTKLLAEKDAEIELLKNALAQAR